MDHFKEYSTEFSTYSMIGGGAGIASLISGVLGAGEVFDKVNIEGADPNFGILMLFASLGNLVTYYFCRRAIKKARNGLEKLVEMSSEAGDYAFTSNS